MSSPSVITRCFSALQRAEIAEIALDNQPAIASGRFSALQRAEIAENLHINRITVAERAFQCSSTSRNC